MCLQKEFRVTRRLSCHIVNLCWFQRRHCFYCPERITTHLQKASVFFSSPPTFQPPTPYGASSPREPLCCQGSGPNLGQFLPCSLFSRGSVVVPASHTTSKQNRRIISTLVKQEVRASLARMPGKADSIKGRRGGLSDLWNRIPWEVILLWLH